MRNLKFPEIEKKVQQSIYGAWGGSNSNDPNPPNGGWYDDGSGITIIGNGGGGGSSGGWNDNGSYDNGGYWGDTGGSGGGAGYELGDNFIDANSMLNFAKGIANSDESDNIAQKVRSAVNATGLATGFTGTAMEAIKAITTEVGFTAKTFGALGSKIGYAGIVVGGSEFVIAVGEYISGEDTWHTTDTLNAISTGLAISAVFFPPNAIILGGLSIAVGLVGTAYGSSN